jgi:hypothetical protein
LMDPQRKREMDWDWLYIALVVALPLIGFLGPKLLKWWRD